MTVKELARITNRNEQSIREWLKKPDCPVGTAIKKDGSSQYFYIIYEKKVGELFCVTSSESRQQL